MVSSILFSFLFYFFQILFNNRIRLTMHSLGISGNNYLSIDGSHYFHSETINNQSVQLIECDIEEKWMKVKKRDIDSSIWIELDLNGLNKGVTIDLSEQGERWDGDSLNGVPFGYGSIYNSNNQLIYKGFIFEGMKVCFGSVFYEDVGIVEYVGGFYKNNRYGCGELFDKKNELIYEGEWYNDKPMDSSSLSISDIVKDDDSIHFGINELIIANQCKCELKYIRLIGFTRLTRIEIGDKCFIDTILFEIENCNELVEVKIGESSFSMEEENSKNHIGFAIRNCSKLQQLDLKWKSFLYCCGYFELKSNNR